MLKLYKVCMNQKMNFKIFIKKEKKNTNDLVFPELKTENAYPNKIFYKFFINFQKF